MQWRASKSLHYTVVLKCCLCRRRIGTLDLRPVLDTRIGTETCYMLVGVGRVPCCTVPVVCGAGEVYSALYCTVPIDTVRVLSSPLTGPLMLTKVMHASRGMCHQYCFHTVKPEACRSRGRKRAAGASSDAEDAGLFHSSGSLVADHFEPHHRYGDTARTMNRVG